MNNKYLIRLDDACPTMNHVKWQRIFDILNQYGIRPMVGIIPHNEDPKQQVDAPNSDFWNNAKEWERKGYAIALHGYNHCYISQTGGINPLWNRSEFAGVDYEVQSQKIRDGYVILKEKGLNPKYFFAPSHTFDENTLKALKEYTDIRIISDTIGIKPYKKGDFIFIPQLGGHCMEMKIPGIWTFCLHPSTMCDKDFALTENFLKAHKDEFIGFEDIDMTHVGTKDIVSKVLSWTYFTQRKIRGIK